MHIQLIKLKSKLPEEELIKKAREREPQFKALPGLLQKFYVKLDEPGHYGGLYIWDSKASMESFRSSDLAAGIPKAYEIFEPPRIETMDMIFKLRD